MDDIVGYEDYLRILDTSSPMSSVNIEKSSPPPQSALLHKLEQLGGHAAVPEPTAHHPSADGAISMHALRDELRAAARPPPVPDTPIPRVATPPSTDSDDAEDAEGDDGDEDAGEEEIGEGGEGAVALPIDHLGRLYSLVDAEALQKYVLPSESLRLSVVGPHDDFPSTDAPHREILTPPRGPRRGSTTTPRVPRPPPPRGGRPRPTVAARPSPLALEAAVRALRHFGGGGEVAAQLRALLPRGFVERSVAQTERSGMGKRGEAAARKRRYDLRVGIKPPKRPVVTLHPEEAPCGLPMSDLDLREIEDDPAALAAVGIFLRSAPNIRRVIIAGTTSHVLRGIINDAQANRRIDVVVDMSAVPDSVYPEALECQRRNEERVKRLTQKKDESLRKNLVRMVERDFEAQEERRSEALRRIAYNIFRTSASQQEEYQQIAKAEAKEQARIERWWAESKRLADEKRLRREIQWEETTGTLLQSEDSRRKAVEVLADTEYAAIRDLWLQERHVIHYYERGLLRQRRRELQDLVSQHYENAKALHRQERAERRDIDAAMRPRIVQMHLAIQQQLQREAELRRLQEEHQRRMAEVRQRIQREQERLFDEESDLRGAIRSDLESAIIGLENQWAESMFSSRDRQKYREATEKHRKLLIEADSKVPRIQFHFAMAECIYRRNPTREFLLVSNHSTVGIKLYHVSKVMSDEQRRLKTTIQGGSISMSLRPATSKSSIAAGVEGLALFIPDKAFRDAELCQVSTSRSINVRSSFSIADGGFDPLDSTMDDSESADKLTCFGSRLMWRNTFVGEIEQGSCCTTTSTVANEFRVRELQTEHGVVYECLLITLQPYVSAGAIRAILDRVVYFNGSMGTQQDSDVTSAELIVTLNLHFPQSVLTGEERGFLVQRATSATVKTSTIPIKIVAPLLEVPRAEPCLFLETSEPLPLVSRMVIHYGQTLSPIQARGFYERRAHAGSSLEECIASLKWTGDPADSMRLEDAGLSAAHYRIAVRITDGNSYDAIMLRGLHGVSLGSVIFECTKLHNETSIKSDLESDILSGRDDDDDDDVWDTDIVSRDLIVRGRIVGKASGSALFPAETLDKVRELRRKRGIGELHTSMTSAAQFEFSDGNVSVISDVIRSLYYANVQEDPRERSLTVDLKLIAPTPKSNTRRSADMDLLQSVPLTETEPIHGTTRLYVTVVPVCEAPVISLQQPTTGAIYRVHPTVQHELRSCVPLEQPLLIAPTATVTCPDEEEFEGGYLEVEIVGGATHGDQLYLDTVTPQVNLTLQIEEETLQTASTTGATYDSQPDMDDLSVSQLDFSGSSSARCLRYKISASNDHYATVEGVNLSKRIPKNLSRREIATAIAKSGIHSVVLATTKIRIDFSKFTIAAVEGLVRRIAFKPCGALPAPSYYGNRRIDVRLIAGDPTVPKHRNYDPFKPVVVTAVVCVCEPLISMSNSILSYKEGGAATPFPGLSLTEGRDSSRPFNRGYFYARIVRGGTPEDRLVFRGVDSVVTEGGMAQVDIDLAQIEALTVPRGSFAKESTAGDEARDEESAGCTRPPPEMLVNIRRQATAAKARHAPASRAFELYSGNRQLIGVGVSGPGELFVGFCATKKRRRGQGWKGERFLTSPVSPPKRDAFRSASDAVPLTRSEIIPLLRHLSYENRNATTSENRRVVLITLNDENSTTHLVAEVEVIATDNCTEIRRIHNTPVVFRHGFDGAYLRVAADCVLHDVNPQRKYNGGQMTIALTTGFVDSDVLRFQTLEEQRLNSQDDQYAKYRAPQRQSARQKSLRSAAVKLRDEDEDAKDYEFFFPAESKDVCVLASDGKFKPHIPEGYYHADLIVDDITGHSEGSLAKIGSWSLTPYRKKQADDTPGIAIIVTFDKTTEFRVVPQVSLKMLQDLMHTVAYSSHLPPNRVRPPARTVQIRLSPPLGEVGKRVIPMTVLPSLLSFSSKATVAASTEMELPMPAMSTAVHPFAKLHVAADYVLRRGYVAAEVTNGFNPATDILRIADAGSGFHKTDRNIYTVKDAFVGKLHDIECEGVACGYVVTFNNSCGITLAQAQGLFRSVQFSVTRPGGLSSQRTVRLSFCEGSSREVSMVVTTILVEGTSISPLQMTHFKNHRFITPSKESIDLFPNIVIAEEDRILDSAELSIDPGNGCVSISHGLLQPSGSIVVGGRTIGRVRQSSGAMEDGVSESMLPSIRPSRSGGAKLHVALDHAAVRDVQHFLRSLTFRPDGKIHGDRPETPPRAESRPSGVRTHAISLRVSVGSVTLAEVTVGVEGVPTILSVNPPGHQVVRGTGILSACYLSRVPHKIRLTWTAEDHADDLFLTFAPGADVSLEGETVCVGGVGVAGLTTEAVGSLALAFVAPPPPLPTVMAMVRSLAVVGLPSHTCRLRFRVEAWLDDETSIVESFTATV